MLAGSNRVVEFRVSQGAYAFLIVYGFFFSWILCTVVGTEVGDWGTSCEDFIKNMHLPLQLRF